MSILTIPENYPKDVGRHEKDGTDYSGSVGFETMLKNKIFYHIFFGDGIIFLFIFLLLIQSVKSEAQMDEGSVPSIGSAKMEEDGTIVLRLRAETPGGGIGDALLRYPPGHPQYDEILHHVGGLEKGQEKPVSPWPTYK